MCNVRIFWLLGLMALTACGPNTIFLGQGLDTPAHHVANGKTLLEQKKFVDACREFERARELDPHSTEAHVGLGLAYAGSGDLEKGMEMMARAEAMAQTEPERAAVQEGYEQLSRIQRE